MPRKPITLYSVLAPAQFMERLRDATDEPHRTLFSFSGYKGDQKVCSIEGRTFRMWRRRYWRNDFAPNFYGAVGSESSGSQISGYFDCSPWTRIMRIWIAGVVLIGAPIFVLCLRELLTGTVSVSGEPWVGVIVFPAMILWGFLLPRLGYFLGSSDESALTALLETNLAAQVDPHTSSPT